MPELDHYEMMRAVAELPDGALLDLAEGPMRDLKPGEKGYGEEEDCRLCDALGRYEDDPQCGRAVKILDDWHNIIGAHSELVKQAIKAGHELREQDPLSEDISKIVGELSYARCSAVYAAATAELMKRSICEVAIPSLRYCEQKHGHDDQARLSLEVGVGEC